MKKHQFDAAIGLIRGFLCEKSFKAIPVQGNIVYDAVSTVELGKLLDGIERSITWAREDTSKGKR